MIRCILIIFIPGFLYACKDSVPFGIIKPKKMQEVLWDVLKADALSKQLAQTDSAKSLQAENVKLTRNVFLIHNITEEQFDKSYAYYTQHPDKMRTMLDSLNAQKSRESTLDTLYKNKRLAIDSVK